MNLVPLTIDESQLPALGPSEDEAHDVVEAAILRKFSVDGGHVIVTLWRGRVHGVTYQMPRRFFWSRIRRNRNMYRYYGEGFGWEKGWPVDFGSSYNRKDGTIRALYSQVADVMSFYTQEFDKFQSDQRWANVDV